MQRIRQGAPDTRVAILSSNRGGHLQVLLEDPVVGRWITLVVGDRPEAYALNHARLHGVPGVALRAGKSNLDLYDLALARLLGEHSIDYVVVAGFPRIVGAETVRAYHDRIAKVHHSLLPEFPGPDPVASSTASASAISSAALGRNDRKSRSRPGWTGPTSRGSNEQKGAIHLPALPNPVGDRADATFPREHRRRLHSINPPSGCRRRSSGEPGSSASSHPPATRSCGWSRRCCPGRTTRAGLRPALLQRWIDGAGRCGGGGETPKEPWLRSRDGGRRWSANSTT